MTEDDDNLSDGEMDMLDLARHGAQVMIDMSSPVEVERANRLLERGLIKTVGQRLEDGGPGVWTLVSRVEAGEKPPPYAPLVALPGQDDGGEA